MVSRRVRYGGQLLSLNTIFSVIIIMGQSINAKLALVIYFRIWANLEMPEMELKMTPLLRLDAGYDSIACDIFH